MIKELKKIIKELIPRGCYSISDFGSFNQHGVDYWNMMRKGEEILRYLSEIEKEFSWEDRQILNQTAELITQLMNKKMTQIEKTNIDSNESK
jgi:hypothetical protein